MINYVNLPSEMKNLLRDFDYITLTKDIHNHNWKYIPLDVAFSKEGKEWFYDKKIPIKNYVLLFKIPRNVEGLIHTDIQQGDISDCAFNIVLSGHGEMQWVKNLEATKYTFNLNGTYYDRYKDITKFDISDKWTGDVGLVRINVPHRVVTTDSDRYCVSIRLVNDISPNTFDEIKEILGV